MQQQISATASLDDRAPTRRDVLPSWSSPPISALHNKVSVYSDETRSLLGSPHKIGGLDRSSGVDNPAALITDKLSVSLSIPRDKLPALLKEDARAIVQSYPTILAQVVPQARVGTNVATGAI